MEYPEGDVWQWEESFEDLWKYERMFELKQGDKSVVEFYGELKSLVDELEMHQPVVTDAVTLRGYYQDLAMSKFLSGLSSTLKSQVWGQILRDSIPT